MSSTSERGNKRQEGYGIETLVRSRSEVRQLRYQPVGFIEVTGVEQAGTVIANIEHRTTVPCSREESGNVECCCSRLRLASRCSARAAAAPAANETSTTVVVAAVAVDVDVAKGPMLRSRGREREREIERARAANHDDGTQRE